MKITILNGSPSGEKGMTWFVLSRMIEGMKEAGAEPEVIHLAGKKIHSCVGCLACWFKTPGRCAIRDDMEQVLPAFNEAATAVLATPVYVDGMTGLLKNCIDRMVAIADPHFELRDGHLRHPTRNAKLKRIALVSVCGFFELDNFDPLIAHVHAICRNLNADYAGAVLRPAAPVMPHVKFLHPFKTHAVSKAMVRAGAELVREGRILAETQAAAAEELVSKETYFEQVNKHFDSELRKIEDKDAPC